MKFWNWILTKLGKRFPLPPRHILTYEEISRYWMSMSECWQRQCLITVLRIRKPVKGDERPNIWVVPPLFSPTQWWPSRVDILGKLGRPEPNKDLIDPNNRERDPFTIRIDREWERQPGIKVKEEVCIANFEL
jgi:hypothetical protein